MNMEYEAVDFSSILEQFTRYAYSPVTIRKIKEAAPLASAAQIQEQLELTKEAGAYLQAGGSVSLGGLGDISSSVKAAKKGITLSGSELIAVSSFLSACKAAAGAFDENYPLLNDLSQSLSLCAPLKKQIDERIDLSGQVRMDATAKLVSLSEKLIDARSALTLAAKRFIKGAESSLMDTTTTFVSGRLCVLVKAADKYKFGGMIHGSSQSGAASYLEPGSLVGANNKVAELQMEIEEEKARICQELSRQVKEQAKSLLSSEETLVLIDFSLAKGQWMLSHDGTVPVLGSASHALRIEHAVHPLLDPKTAVANTYELKDSQSCLMITGSNTGGKTVILKTIGLFLLLAHSGFPVSAHHALLPLYDSFYFVIGDQQSIEENLSTFSAHVREISRVVEHADENTFALLDEIGSGTDPQEGAALAQAVLEELIARRATVVTSTHYQSVKAFGKTNPHVLCGSVEFDAQTLKPTYRYLPGISGASYAFAIAGQYGLARQILDRAKEIRDESQSKSEKALALLEKQQMQVQKKMDRFDALIADAHRLQKEADEDRRKWETMKKRLDAEYESRLDEMLFEKREEAKQIIRDLKKSTHQARHEQIEQLGKLTALGEDRTGSENKETQERQWKPGDYVRIEALGNHGEIQSVRKDKASVLVNGRRVTVSIDQLTPMKKPAAEKSIRKQSVQRSFKAFPMELNLIGMHVDEGLNALEHYLDQAVYHRVKTVRIIHGVGTGALRSAVWNDLKSHPQVREITSAPPSQGGLGATLVELK